MMEVIKLRHTKSLERKLTRSFDCLSHTSYYIAASYLGGGVHNKHRSWPLVSKKGKHALTRCDWPASSWTTAFNSTVELRRRKSKGIYYFPFPPFFEFPNQHLSLEGPSSEGLPYENNAPFFLPGLQKSPRLHEQISGFQGMDSGGEEKTAKKTHTDVRSLDHRITVVIWVCVHKNISRPIEVQSQ